MEKLTAVTVIGNGRKVQMFVLLPVDANGKAIIDENSREMRRALTALGISRGQTYSVS